MQRYWEMFSDPEMIYRLYHPQAVDLSDFELSVQMAIQQFPTDRDILFAYYMYEDYSGRAFVLYRKTRVLYEAHGSHCSCDGLQGQWKPERTTWAALSIRVFDYAVPNSDAREELARLIRGKGRANGPRSGAGKVRR